MARAWIRATIIPFFCVAVILAVLSCQRNEPDIAAYKENAEKSTLPRDRPTAQPDHNRGVLRTIRDRGELRVGMQVGYAPFQMLGPQGNLVGLDVDAAQILSRALGVGLRIVRQDWAELIPSLLEGKTDLVMSGVAITPERNFEVVFSAPLLETGRMYLVHQKNAERFRKFSDLDAPGVFVVSVPGAVGKLRIRQVLPKAAFREFPDREAALNEVIQGRAHAYIHEEFDVRLACAKRPDLLIGRFTPLTFEPIAWAIAPGDGHWLNWLNNMILSMKRDGTLDELKKKWLQDYYLDIIAHTR